jgi:hypothetical protein
LVSSWIWVCLGRSTCGQGRDELDTMRRKRTIYI